MRRWANTVLCGLALALGLGGAPAQAALKPPPGFYAAAGDSGKKARPCEGMPEPFTGALRFPSKFAGSDKARDDFNPQAYAKYKSQTAPINTLEREVSAHVDNYLDTGRSEGVRCAMDALAAWAKAGALLSDDTDHTGKSVRKWALASIASAYLRLKFSRSEPLAPFAAQADAVEAWLSRLAARVVKDWDKQPLKKMNNHEYWAAWAVMAAAVALDEPKWFKWAAGQYRIAARQIDGEGYLPNELKRETRALTYHNYSLGPLAMMAAFAKANGINLAGENDAALGRLARRVLRGVDDPEIFEKRTGHEQHTEELEEDSKFSWLEPYCWTLECPADVAARIEELRPLKTYRLGGDLTYLFTGARVRRG